VVFYCDDYARTDLTACKAANQKMFYVADPNPNAVFGASAANIGGGSTGGAATATTGATTTSSAMHASGASIIFIGLLVALRLQ